MSLSRNHDPRNQDNPHSLLTAVYCYCRDYFIYPATVGNVHKTYAQEACEAFYSFPQNRVKKHQPTIFANLLHVGRFFFL